MYRIALVLEMGLRLLSTSRSDTYLRLRRGKISLGLASALSDFCVLVPHAFSLVCTWLRMLNQIL